MADPIDKNRWDQHIHLAMLLKFICNFLNYNDIVIFEGRLTKMLYQKMKKENKL